jgi:hypothetical protein
VLATANGIGAASAANSGPTGTIGQTGLSGATTTEITGTVLHRHSKLKPQAILDKIPYIELPSILGPGVTPTSASLTPSSASYATNCGKAAGNYRFYDLTTTGYADKTCNFAAVPPLNQNLPTHSLPGQYGDALNQLGDAIRMAVKAPLATETTLSVGGSSKVVVALYTCSQLPTVGVVRIALRRVAKRKYARATLTMC